MAFLLIDPDETLDYVMDWSSWLGADTIDTSSWAVSPTGPALSGESNTATTATVFVSGATPGEVYALTSRVVTAGGRTAERSISLRCDSR